MKILIGIVVSVIVLGGVGWVVATKIGGMSSEPTAVSVKVEEVGRGKLVEIVSAPGQVEPKTKVQISARVPARINELPYDEGEVVKKGQVVVQLDASELEAELRATEARAAGQKAQLDEATARVEAQGAQIEADRIMLADAERDLNRQMQLLESSDVSQSIVDTAKAKFDQLKHQLESAESQLEANRLNLKVISHQIEAAEAEIMRAKEDLGYTTITSPIDGIITRLNAKAGEMVVTGTMNNPGTVIMEISDLSEMQVDAQIDESNVAAVKEGQKATVRITAYPDEEFTGVVDLVGLDTAEDQRGSNNFSSSSLQGKWYRARIILDTNGRRIPVGLSADVDIETKVHEDVIKIPTQAVMGRSPEEIPEKSRSRPEVDMNKTLITVVFRYEDGKAVLTPVTIGSGDMTHTVIESGLKLGEQIITGPYKVLPELKDGQAVKAEEATTKPATTSSTTVARAAG